MASRGIWQKELKAGTWKFAVGILLLLFTAISIPLIYEYTIKLMSNTPVPEFARGQLASLKDFRYFVWSQWFGKNLTQMGAMVAIIFGAGIVSSEVTRRTIHFLLAKPIRREEIFTVKYIVNLVNIALITALSTLALYITLVAVNRTYPAAQMLQQTILAAAGLSVIYSIAVYFSTVFDQTIKSAVASILAMFLLYVPGWVAPFEKYSLFYQMSGQGIYEGRGFPLITLVILVGLAALFYILGRKRFARRDF